MNDDDIAIVPPTVMFPLLSLTIFVVDPEGWMMLILLRVLMAASC